MSSTEYKTDRRELHFMLHEVLKCEDLCQFPKFADFDAELFEMVIEEASNFAEKVLAPINESGDKEGCRMEDGQAITPEGFKNAWEQLGEGGWLGVNLDPEYGGQGLPSLIALAAREPLLAANQAFSVGSTLTTGATEVILSFGSDSQKTDYCEPLLSGKWAGTMCLTEAHAGSAVGDIKSLAVKEGDHYLIKGSKQFITSGDHDMSDNIIHLLLARTPDAPAGTQGISLFIVPKVRLDGTPNDVQLVGLERKMGIHASPTCTLSFGENNECHGYLLQEEQRGMSQMFQMMNEARLLVALQGTAGAGAALGYAQAYAKERVQGQSLNAKKLDAPTSVLIVEHPDVRRMLLHMKAVTEGLRGLLYSSAYYLDCASHGPEESREHYQNLLDLQIPIAKAFATDQGFEVACMGTQVLGGVGYTKDFPLEQNVRDQKIASIYEGTNGIQALDLVGRKLTLKDGALVKSLMRELACFDKQELSATLDPLFKEWTSYRALMFEGIQSMQKMFMLAGKSGYVLYACNMLALMGDVLCAFYSLKQAIVAQNKLDQMDTGDAKLKDFVKENIDARFYWNKVRTTEFYIYSVLPRALANSRVLKNANLAPLNAVL